MTQIRAEETAQIQKRGYIWQCAITPDKEQYMANPEAKKQPCGHWNYYFGKRWAYGKSKARWQGYCQNPNCQPDGSRPKKRQLNLGIMHPEPPRYYDTKEAAQRAARRRNEEVETIDLPKSRWLD